MIFYCFFDLFWPFLTPISYTKIGVFCRALRTGVPKTILFSDESAHTALGGGRDGISREGMY